MPKDPANRKPGKLKGRRKGNRLTEREKLWYDIENEKGNSDLHGNGHATGLRSWMKQYAIWLVTNPGMHKMTEHMRAASGYAGYPIPYRTIQYFRQRGDFKEYVAKVEGDMAELVREQMKMDGRFYLDAHKVALARVMQEVEAGNPDALTLVPKFTVPMLGAIVPKKVEQQVTSTRVSINVGNASPATQRLLASVEAEEEIPSVEYEIEGKDTE